MRTLPQTAPRVSNSLACIDIRGMQSQLPRRLTSSESEVDIVEENVALERESLALF
jgi:hypothetical protein